MQRKEEIPMKEKSKEFIEQCLKDCGFQSDEIRNILDFIQNDEKKKLKKVLKKQRCNLLDKLHIDQKMIDCLDYFIRDMIKEGFIVDE